MRFFLILLMVLSGCAHVDVEGQDPRLTSYIAALKTEYYEITGIHLNTDISINIRDLTSKKAFGLCHTHKAFMSTSSEIFIDRAFFEKYKRVKDYITIVLLHEIGHCVYGLGHTSDVIEIGLNTFPVSIMNPNALLAASMPNYKEYYYEQFNEEISKPKFLKMEDLGD